MDVTGLCGSCPCTGALTLSRWWMRSRKPRRLTLPPSSESLDLTIFVKCNALVSLPSSLQASKLFLIFFPAILFYFWILYVLIQEISCFNILKENIILKTCFIWCVNFGVLSWRTFIHFTSLFKKISFLLIIQLNSRLIDI